MSASGWLIMAVRTCNPFQWKTNAATVLYSKTRPGPPVCLPGHNTWTAEKAPRGARMCRHTVICSKHDGMNKNGGFNKIAWQPLLVLHLLFVSFCQVAQAGGAEAALTSEKWMWALTKDSNNHSIWEAGLCIRKGGFKDTRGCNQSSLTCSWFSKWTPCHVLTWQ